MHHPSFSLRQAIWLVAALACLPAAAQSVKPGLWEISTRMTHGDQEMQAAMQQMQQQMASMPAAQRKQMEAMLANQGMALDGKGGMRVKSCITPEAAQKLEVPTQEGDCTTTPGTRSGNTMRFSYQCTDPVAKGQGSVTFVSPTAYQLHSDSSVTEDGKTQKVSMQAEGRWLSADCAGAMNDPKKAKRK